MFLNQEESCILIFVFIRLVSLYFQINQTQFGRNREGFTVKEKFNSGNEFQSNKFIIYFKMYFVLFMYHNINTVLYN